MYYMRNKSGITDAHWLPISDSPVERPRYALVTSTLSARILTLARYTNETIVFKTAALNNLEFPEF